MNIELQYNLDFLAAIYFNGNLELNSYEVVLQMVTRSTDSKINNVALDRIKAFVYGELASTVFINQEHNDSALVMQALGFNMCTLPEEPVDQIVGIMLYSKLNAITEGHLQITRLDIASLLGDHVWYKHSEDDALGPFVKDGWWSKANTQKDTLDSAEIAENVVKVQSTGWHEYGLEWPEKEKTAKVFTANFRKNDNNTTR